MADRTLTAGVITETEATEYRTAGFVLLDFDTDPVYVWTGTRPYTTAITGELSESSHTYLGIGSLGSVDGILETADRSTNGVKFQLSGVGNDLLANALEQDYQGRDAKIWLAYLDEDELIIADPFPLFAGFMDVMSLVDGDKQGAIEIQCESLDATLKRNSESLLTDEEQQRVFPGDLGLEFVLSSQDLVLSWGEPGLSKSGPPREPELIRYRR